MSTALLPCVELAPRGEHLASVVWLHGLGADGHDFESIVPELRLGPELGIRWIFPHAPSIPVTLNGGMVMPAWYDILDADIERRADEAGVRRSAAQVVDLIARERELGIPPERILLAGFSQGGAIAYHVALRYPERLAGVLALSTYLVAPERLASERSPASASLPIFAAHGTFDPMVPVARGADARDALTALGYEVEWHTYPMQHQVCLEEIRDVAGWITRCLA